MSEKQFEVPNISCHHCEMTVDKALTALPGVVESHATHEAGKATVVTEGEVDAAAMAQAVEAKGYHVTGHDTKDL